VEFVYFANGLVD